ncbi:MAG: GTP cyclohydrolase II [Gammaproteobacteria bacterium]
MATKLKTDDENYIKLTSHPSIYGQPPTQLKWGSLDPIERGPIIPSNSDSSKKNAIGSYSGAYSIYRALAIAVGSLDPSHIPDLTNTAPVVDIGPYKTWKGRDKIVSLDPFGHLASFVFKNEIESGFDIRPTIAITQAHIDLPEIRSAIKSGRLKPDGQILNDSGEVRVTKAAIDPVWYLPGIAERFELPAAKLRKSLFEFTGGMFPELITRPDLDVFLPPIGGTTIYVFGNVKDLADAKVPLTCRVHDECNGSDVFGSDICTCRPYLAYGIEECINAAQHNGVGLVIYNRKEGRALGEVTKFLVYNARKRQIGGDRADTYFERTECVAGVQDMRFQELMPDVLHWLGIKVIHRFVSMSNMKSAAITKSGINIKNQISIPLDRIPKDAQVEMGAKKAAGYYSEEPQLTKTELSNIKGRTLDDSCSK